MALILRPMIAADLPAKVRWANDPRVQEWIGWSEQVNLEGTQRWFASQQSDPRILLFTVAFEDQPIGFVKLGRSEDNREGELCGIMIGEPDYWGRGLGKLTVHEMLRIAFEDQGWERFWGHFAAWNHRSIALHQSFGMTLAGKADYRRRHVDGTEHDMLILAIRRATWQANQPESAG